MTIRRANRLLAGLITGSLAGLASGLSLCFSFFVSGRPTFAPFQLIAGNLIEDGALIHSQALTSVLMGIFFLIIGGAGLGGLFSFVILTSIPIRLAAAALLVALSIFLAFELVIFPAGINLAMAVRMPSGTLLLGSLVFGLVLNLIAKIEKFLLERDLIFSAEQKLDRAADTISAGTPANQTIEIIYAAPIRDLDPENEWAKTERRGMKTQLDRAQTVAHASRSRKI